jgi:uncharacterized RDD family membrane protein YckC
MSAPTPFPEPSQDPYYQPQDPYYQQQAGPPMGGPMLAGWWSRVGAAILDALIAIAILIVPVIAIIVVLFVFWLLGFALHFGGGLIHLLLVVAAVLFVINMFSGRTVV